MFEGWKQSWRTLKHAEVGRRFEALHEVHRRSRTRWSRPVTMLAGVVVIVAGIVALAAPGPGLLMIALGAGMIARESAGMARALDGTEIRVRYAFVRLRAIWRRASAPGKILIGLVGAGLVGLALVAGYRVLIR